MPQHLPKLGKYTRQQLEDDKNYIPTKEAVALFPFLAGKNSSRVISGWIVKGYLFGRCRNMANKRNKHANRWEVFVPDVARFKQDRIKKT